MLWQELVQPFSQELVSLRAAGQHSKRGRALITQNQQERAQRQKNTVGFLRFTDNRGAPTLPRSIFLMLKEEDLATRHHPTATDLRHLFLPTFSGCFSLFLLAESKETAPEGATAASCLHFAPANT